MEQKDRDHLSKTDINIVDNFDYFDRIRSVSKENIYNDGNKLKFLSSLFTNIRTYGKKTPGLRKIYEQIRFEKEHKKIGFGFLRKNDQDPQKYIREYLEHSDRRGFISELYNHDVRYFSSHFDNILFLYGLPSIPLLQFLTIFGENMTQYENLYTVKGKISPGPLGCVMIGNKIYMGINKQYDENEDSDYVTITGQIEKHIIATNDLHSYKVILIHNKNYWGGNRHVPFKRANKGKMACNNGSTCIEPILFNYLLENGLITNENFRTKKGYSFTCLWVGKPEPENESEYIIGTKGTGFHERIYERLFTEHYLRNFPGNRQILIDAYHIVFNLMLPCPGCQMNYNEIIHRNTNIQWDKTGCEKDLESIKISEPKILLDAPDSSEFSDLQFRSKKSKNKKSKNKKSKNKKSKKSKNKKRSVQKRLSRSKSIKKSSKKSNKRSIRRRL